MTSVVLETAAELLVFDLGRSTFDGICFDDLIRDRMTRPWSILRNEFHAGVSREETFFA